MTDSLAILGGALLCMVLGWWLIQKGRGVKTTGFLANNLRARIQFVGWFLFLGPPFFVILWLIAF